MKPNWRIPNDGPTTLCWLFFRILLRHVSGRRYSQPKRCLRCLEKGGSAPPIPYKCTTARYWATAIAVKQRLSGHREGRFRAAGTRSVPLFHSRRASRSDESQEFVWSTPCTYSPEMTVSFCEKLENNTGSVLSSSLSRDFREIVGSLNYALRCIISTQRRESHFQSFAWHTTSSRPWTYGCLLMILVAECNLKYYA